MQAVNSLEPSILTINRACTFKHPLCTISELGCNTLGQGVIELIKILLSGSNIESNPEAVFTLLAFLYCCVQFDSIKVGFLAFALFQLSIPLIQNILFFYRRCSASVVDIHPLVYSFSPFFDAQHFRGG